MPTTGYGPSGLPSVGAGGNATETSSGIPSQLGIWAVAVPQNRWPDACTTQLTGVAVFVNTWVIAASALAGISDPAAATAATISILRIRTAPPPQTTGHPTTRRRHSQLSGGSAPQLGDDRAGQAQAQGEDAGEVEQHAVRERGLVRVQALEGVDVEPH